MRLELVKSPVVGIRLSGLTADDEDHLKKMGVECPGDIVQFLSGPEGLESYGVLPGPRQEVSTKRAPREVVEEVGATEPETPEPETPEPETPEPETPEPETPEPETLEPETSGYEAPQSDWGALDENGDEVDSSALDENDSVEK